MQKCLLITIHILYDVFRRVTPRPLAESRQNPLGFNPVRQFFSKVTVAENIKFLNYRLMFPAET